MKSVDISMNINIAWNGKVSAFELYCVVFDWRMYFLPATLDSTRIIEVLDPDTVIFYQLHKRVWPTAQRDSCFWSHIRCISTSEEDQPMWLVVNHTTSHPLASV